MKLSCGSLELYRFHKQKFSRSTVARISEFSAVLNDLTDVVDRQEHQTQQVSVSSKP